MVRFGISIKSAIFCCVSPAAFLACFSFSAKVSNYFTSLILGLEVTDVVSRVPLVRLSVVEADDLGGDWVSFHARDLFQDEGHVSARGVFGSDLSDGFECDFHFFYFSFHFTLDFFPYLW